MEEKIAKIFECDTSYANKIIASLKMNLPIQGATPKQMYDGYKIVNEPVEIKTAMEILLPKLKEVEENEKNGKFCDNKLYIIQAMNEFADQFK